MLARALWQGWVDGQMRVLQLELLSTCNSKSMPTRAFSGTFSGIHEVILRNPEGLRNITECIHEKARCRHALTSLYPGYEIITR